MRETVRGWIHDARHVAVLTGAGMSAESGVPTFRDAQTGLWSRFNPQDLATEAAFRAHPQRVWDWYAERRGAIGQVAPNAGHAAIAAFQRRHPGRLTLVTQNVDGLHQRAGSDGTLALHGHIAEDRWLDPPRDCCRAGMIEPGRPPRCTVCGNLRRPAVVWFGEMLPAPMRTARPRMGRPSIWKVAAKSPVSWGNWVMGGGLERGLSSRPMWQRGRPRTRGGLQAEQLVEFVGRHPLEFFERRELSSHIRQIDRGRRALCPRAWHRLDDGYGRRAWLSRRARRSSGGGTWRGRGAGRRRGIVEARWENGFRRALRQRKPRYECERCRSARQNDTLHCFASGKLTGSAIGRKGSSPPSIHA